MKVIIAGSRRLNTDKELVWLVADAMFKSGFFKDVTEIVSGGARGIDLAGETFATSRGIRFVRFNPEWSVGKHAGLLRNKEMAYYADSLILIWDGSSRGSANMLKNAKERKLKIYEYVVN